MLPRVWLLPATSAPIFASGVGAKKSTPWWRRDGGSEGLPLISQASTGRASHRRIFLLLYFPATSKPPFTPS
ncbi:hypothetical protein HYQ46_012262 [Verticillium longisporum]|nr:hypothetical protein HYQ46_012262 [Verticillium longisporum]